MPRLQPSLFLRAARISPHLVTLLPACRTIDSAQNELRWIREHVRESASGSESESRTSHSPAARTRSVNAAVAGSTRRKSKWGRGVKIKIAVKGKGRTEHHGNDYENKVAYLVARRGTGEPLQYVLGSQPFADLDIRCEKGVLIPRPETEAWVSFLADMVFSPTSSPFSGRRQRPQKKPDDEAAAVAGESKPQEKEGGKGLRIVDFCSGTGCISLSLYARGLDFAAAQASRGITRSGRKDDFDGDFDSGRTSLGRRGSDGLLRVYGFDVEPRAVRLARRNVLRNTKRLLLHARDGGGSDCGDNGPYAATAIKTLSRGITYHHADIFSDEWMDYLYSSDACAAAEEVTPPPTTTRHQSHPSEDRNKLYGANSSSSNNGTHGNNDNEVSPKVRIDILVSNPPYISERGFGADTGRSVRNFEPKLALVPAPSHIIPGTTTTTTTSPNTPPHGSQSQDFSCSTPAVLASDIFYHRLLSLASVLRPRIAVFEVGDMAQAVRVVEMALGALCTPEINSENENEKDGNDRYIDTCIDGSPPSYEQQHHQQQQQQQRWAIVEIWRDWPDIPPPPCTNTNSPTPTPIPTAADNNNTDAKAEEADSSVLVQGRTIPIRGSGHGRVVFLVAGAEEGGHENEAREWMRSLDVRNMGFRRVVY